MLLVFIVVFKSEPAAPVTCVLLPSASPIAIAVAPRTSLKYKLEEESPATVAKTNILLDDDDGVILADKPVISVNTNPVPELVNVSVLVVETT